MGRAPKADLGFQEISNPNFDDHRPAQISGTILR